MALAREIDAVGTSQRLVAAGFAPLPIRNDGSKAPGIRQVGPLESYQPRPAWEFRDRHIGIVAGTPSGHLVIVDFDVPDKHWRTDPGPWEAPAFAPWMALVAETFGKPFALTLPVVSSKSGGRHVYFRVADPESPGADALLATTDYASRPMAGPDGKVADRVTIETRARGAYTVCPPSPGYSWLNGGPETVPSITAEQAAVLLGLARLLDESLPKPPPKPIDRPARRTNAELRPGDDFNLRGDIEPYLLKNRWAFCYEYGKFRYWKHPNATQDKSATVFRRDDGVLALVCHSNNVDAFRSVPQKANGHRSMTIFEAYVFLEHGGDFRMATKALAGDGYGSNREVA